MKIRLTRLEKILLAVVAYDAIVNLALHQHTKTLTHRIQRMNKGISGLIELNGLYATRLDEAGIEPSEFDQIVINSINTTSFS